MFMKADFSFGRLQRWTSLGMRMNESDGHFLTGIIFIMVISDNDSHDNSQKRSYQAIIITSLDANQSTEKWA